MNTNLVTAVLNSTKAQMATEPAAAVLPPAVNTPSTEAPVSSAATLPASPEKKPDAPKAGTAKDATAQAKTEGTAAAAPDQEKKEETTTDEDIRNEGAALRTLIEALKKKSIRDGHELNKDQNQAIRELSLRPIDEANKLFTRETKTPEEAEANKEKCKEKLDAVMKKIVNNEEIMKIPFVSKILEKNSIDVEKYREQAAEGEAPKAKQGF